MDVVIFGRGGHGRDIGQCFREPAYLDDDPHRQTSWVDLSGATPDIIGINDPATRRVIAERWPDVPGIWVHPRAVRGPEVVLGRHTHVGANAFLTRCTVGDFVTIGPSATICGDVTIGDGVLIGAGAVVRNFVTIGDGATIGCGAVVVADVEPGTVVVGNPAKALMC
jgi:UDP-3-O-[3-hydroxymyristoyl] glucosamine N-acyltransferase